MAQKKKRPRKGVEPALTFSHAMVYVRELAPALHFYAGLLGFKEIEVYHNAYARLRPASGQGTIALHLIEPGKTLPPEMESVYISSTSFTQLPKMMPRGWKHAYLNDPDGHEVSLYWVGRKRLQKSIIR